MKSTFETSFKKLDEFNVKIAVIWDIKVLKYFRFPLNFSGRGNFGSRTLSAGESFSIIAFCCATCFFRASRIGIVTFSFNSG